MKIDAIIFDLGGTLLEYTGEHDSWPELEGPGFEAAHEYLCQSGLELPSLVDFQRNGFAVLPGRWKKATKGVENLTVASLLGELIVGYGIDLPSDEIIMEAASRYQAAVCAGVVPMPDSYHTVKSLKESGYKLGIVSNTMFDGTRHIADMRRYDLDSFFDAKVFSADVNKWKPNPDVFIYILEKLNVEPKHSIFIGDDPDVDVVGGKRAGLFTIHYPSNQRFSSPDGIKPDAIISSLSELPILVARLNDYSGHNGVHTP